jgi:hypothetical protein
LLGEDGAGSARTSFDQQINARLDAEEWSF